MTAGPPRPLTTLSLVALCAAGTVSCAKTGAEPTTPVSSDPPATARDGAPVFPLPSDIEAVISTADLPVRDTSEPAALRIRAHLDVFINGQAVTVPKGIGVVDEKRSSPLYTADDSGVLHVTAREQKETFRLGQFFQLWNVPLDKDSIGGFDATSDGKQLLAFVNGELTVDPSTVHITDGAEIVVWYGNRGVNPVVPTSYPFPG